MVDPWTQKNPGNRNCSGHTGPHLRPEFRWNYALDRPPRNTLSTNLSVKAYVSTIMLSLKNGLAVLHKTSLLRKKKNYMYDCPSAKGTVGPNLPLPYRRISALSVLPICHEREVLISPLMEIQSSHSLTGITWLICLPPTTKATVEDVS